MQVTYRCHSHTLLVCVLGEAFPWQRVASEHLRRPRGVLSVSSLLYRIPSPPSRRACPFHPALSSACFVTHSNKKHAPFATCIATALHRPLPRVPDLPPLEHVAWVLRPRWVPLRVSFFFQGSSGSSSVSKGTPPPIDWDAISQSNRIDPGERDGRCDPTEAAIRRHRTWSPVRWRIRTTCDRHQVRLRSTGGERRRPVRSTEAIGRETGWKRRRTVAWSACGREGR